MKRYKLRLTLKSRLGTPMTADTLFGHLCWGMLYYEGQAALEKFLDDMQSSQPPLIIGDPCPEGFLPSPILPPASVDEYNQMKYHLQQHIDSERAKQDDPSKAVEHPAIEAHDKLKEYRKRQWISVENFSKCIDNLSALSLLQANLESPSSPKVLKEATVFHNTINRITLHTAEEGGLFVQTEYFPDCPDFHFDLYILSTLEPERIRTIFEQGLIGGYGADASTGKGHIEVGQINSAPLPEASNPNAVLAMGVFCPAEDDPARGWWRTEVRLGKVGGAWLVDSEKYSPFKYPLILLKAGSILSPPPDRPYLGRIVPNVHPTLKKVVTYAMTPILPVRCPSLDTELKEQSQ